MEKYDLPKGIVKACAGIVEGCSSEPYITAVNEAGKVVGTNYSKSAKDKREILIQAIKLNLVNQKEYPYETLVRKYGIPESERQFRREKRKYCYAMAQILGMVEKPGRKSE